MTNENIIKLRRKIGSERATIMLPLNVVMVARIQGSFDHSKIEEALAKLRSRHPLLAVRVDIDDKGVGKFTTEVVPAITTHLEQRHNGRQWICRVLEELRTPFPLETGPLVRCAIIKSNQVSEIILCGHHAICDGMSFIYLIRDILKQVGIPSDIIKQLPPPPAIDKETASTPPSIRFVAKAAIKLVNQIWKKKNLHFDFKLMEKLHNRYWEKNAGAQLLIGQLSELETSQFVKCCKKEGVTVNSALWAAFLSVQHEVQGSNKRFRSRAGLAISTRDKLKVPVGESFGFYASSHKVLLKQYQNKSFWYAARTVHKQLRHSIESANPFRMLSATLLDPTLLDSLYFCKYGFAKNRMSDKLLKKMFWDRINFGFSITNVGRVDIPTSYGDLKLDAVYGPVVYSDVNEKTVGVITVGNKLSFIMSYNVSNVDSDIAERLRGNVLELVREATELSDGNL
jgi:NRPS condensation-like uncharacterized protein